MGQRTASTVGRRVRAPAVTTNTVAARQVSIFVTDLGWMGLVGREGRLVRLVLGHASAEAVRDDLRARHIDDAVGRPAASLCDDIDGAESDWNPSLRHRLQDFATGMPVRFDEFALELPPSTAFQRRVLEETQAIPYGQTMTYAELAARAGSPGAARAVGNVMASNRVPVVIPCHRVVAAGTLGGYSAPQGVELKKRLLTMEADAVRDRSLGNSCTY